MSPATPSPPTPEEIARRAGEALTERMHAVGVSQQDLAKVARVSVSTLRKLQHGTGSGYREAGLGRISLALGWPADAMLRLLDGEPPELISPTQTIDRSGHGIQSTVVVGEPTVISTGGTVVASGEVTAKVIRGRDSNLAFIRANIDKLDAEQAARLAGYFEGILEEGT